MFPSNAVTVCTKVLVLALALAGACAKTQQKASETAERAEQTSGHMQYEDKVTAVVENVDRETRTVTLREPDGEMMTVAVSDNVAMDRIEPNDKVNVAYQESLAFELKEPGTALGRTAEATSERLPQGVQFGRRVTSTVEILAVAPNGTTATFRNAEGQVRSVDVLNPENQEKVANLKPGDSVEVAYTERLAIECHRPA